MKAGTFVNYQLAEAILLLHKFQNDNRSLKEFDYNAYLPELKELREKEIKIDTVGNWKKLLHSSTLDIGQSQDLNENHKQTMP